MLTTDQVAELAGITPASLRVYVQRGSAPKPDGYLGRTPWWKRETVDEWLANRPRRGRPAGSVPSR